MRVLRSNNFARRIQSFPWKQIQPHHLIITNAKRTARFFPRCPLIFFLYLILPIAHKEVRRVVPAVRMLAYRHRHRCVTFSQYVCPMPRRIHPNLRNKICPARFPRCARAVLAPLLETVCVIVRVLKNCSKAISPVGSFVRSRAVTVSLISCILMRSYHACRIKIFIP